MFMVDENGQPIMTGQEDGGLEDGDMEQQQEEYEEGD